MKLSPNNVSYGVAWATPKDDKEGCQKARPLIIRKFDHELYVCIFCLSLNYLLFRSLLIAIFTSPFTAFI